ncbi:MAG: ABC transporter permease, partial [Chromatiaceae bacterium]
MKRLINQRPSRGTAVFLGLLPFLMLIAVYLVASDARLAENPNDKLLPSFATLGDSVQRLVLEPSKRTGEIELWADTWASLRRLSLGVGAAALIGLTFGVMLGALPLARAGFAPFVASLSLIPPLALLPILFIVFGLEELSKVVLIVFGIAPVIIRDLQQRVQELPREQH